MNLITDLKSILDAADGSKHSIHTAIAQSDLPNFMIDNARRILAMLEAGEVLYKGTQARDRWANTMTEAEADSVLEYVEALTAYELAQGTKPIPTRHQP